eukprot:1159746-Pelagomonas_calceolata.AAC.1
MQTARLGVLCLLLSCKEASLDPRSGSWNGKPPIMLETENSPAPPARIVEYDLDLLGPSVAHITNMVRNGAASAEAKLQERRNTQEVTKRFALTNLPPNP